MKKKRLEGGDILLKNYSEINLKLILKYKLNTFK